MPLSLIVTAHHVQTIAEIVAQNIFNFLAVGLQVQCCSEMANGLIHLLFVRGNLSQRELALNMVFRIASGAEKTAEQILSGFRALYTPIIAYGDSFQRKIWSSSVVVSRRWSSIFSVS